jgi:hypothetical protein
MTGLRDRATRVLPKSSENSVRQSIGQIGFGFGYLGGIGPYVELFARERVAGWDRKRGSCSKLVGSSPRSAIRQRRRGGDYTSRRRLNRPGVFEAYTSTSARWRPCAQRMRWPNKTIGLRE